MLQSLVEYEEGKEKLSKEEKKVMKENFLARYYEKVMRLFEEVSAPQYVILVAQEATRILRYNDDRSVSGRSSGGAELDVWVEVKGVGADFER